MSKFQIQGRRVWVAGHRGMAGAAVVRRLAGENCEIVTAPRTELDLLDQAAVNKWTAANRIDVVILAAATVGGILANSSRPADFIYDNLVIETNVIDSARRAGVKKLLFLGSSCTYPRMAEQPMKEEALLTGALEPTNEWYAIAKIAGIKLCQAYRRQHGSDFISLMPANLYGPGDRYDALAGHVVAALIMKVHDAKLAKAPSVELWGTGQPRREFLFTEDLADACVFALENYSEEPFLNVGTGVDMTIVQLAENIAEVVGWHGEFSFDTSKPGGAPQKVMDVSRMRALGWSAKTDIKQGLAQAYAWFLANAIGNPTEGFIRSTRQLVPEADVFGKEASPLC